MSNYLPLVIVEGVMVFGGALLFGWWQLRSVRRDREKSAEEARRKAAEARAEVWPDPAPTQALTSTDCLPPGPPSDPPT